MRYSNELDKVIKLGLDELIKSYKDHNIMFDSKRNLEYCKLYFKLLEEAKNSNLF